jgi:hypothetical protein
MPAMIRVTQLNKFDHARSNRFDPTHEVPWSDARIGVRIPGTRSRSDERRVSVCLRDRYDFRTFIREVRKPSGYSHRNSCRHFSNRTDLEAEERIRSFEDREETPSIDPKAIS